MWGVAIPGEFLRAPLERALSAAFGVPTRIEGPLQLRTGLVVTATADALVLDDPSGPVDATLARATRPGVRIDLVSLARRVVALDEVTGERLDLTLARGADGRGNWAPIFASAPDAGPSPVTFAGIARLRIGSIAGTYRTHGAAPARFGVAEFDGTLPLRNPTTARGTATIPGYTIAFDLRTASLAGFQAAGAAIPVQGTLEWSGARVAVDGSVAPDDARLDAAVQVTSDDAGQLLAALGVAAHEAGRLDARGRVGVTAADAVVTDLAFTLGKSTLSGNARVAWGAPRARVAIDVASERIDLAPFLAAAPTTEKPAAETFVELLEDVAAGADAEVKAAVGELSGVPVTLHDLKLEGRGGDRVVAVQGHAVVAGTRVNGTLDYDARKPQRVLAARLDGGAVSTERLLGQEHGEGFSGATGGIRGQLRAQGATPRAIVASAQGTLDARDLRWSVPGKGGQPVRGRFDSARLSLQGSRASSAEVTGKLGTDPCTLKVSGGALGPLFEGESWPLKLTGTCGTARLAASGRVAHGEKGFAADLAFDASANRIGPLMQAYGIPPDAPHPAAARGTLTVADDVARVKLDALRLGRTTGSGMVTVPFDGKGVPRVRLALAVVNLAEINALGAPGPVTPPDPLEREMIRKNLRLPDADFEIAAERVELGDATLRGMHVSGAMRASRLPLAPFGFEWQGVQVTGALAADFSGALPRLQLDGKAQNADLGALLARFGQKGVGLRVGAVSLRAGAEGARLGALLASARLDATIERGRLDLARPPLPGLSGPADFSAALKAAPGQPATLAARGTMVGEPFDLGLETPSLTALVRATEPIPATLRLTLGDARVQASGRVARDGTGEGRIQLNGEHVDRLGKLAGIELPAVGPYAASGAVAVSADSIRASDIDLSFGRSRLLGQAQMQVRRGGRPFHSVTLRAPALHLEDLGAGRWLDRSARPKDGEAAVAQQEEALFARVVEVLRTADVDGVLDIEALQGGGERFASGRLRTTLAAGALRLLLQDVRTEGGTIDADLRIDAGGPQPKFALQARVDGFEFAPLARTLDPATTLGGRLDLVAALAAQGPPGHLLPTVAGTVDVAVYPRDLRAGVLDLWGTGLLQSMLRSLDPSTRSEVECAVASVDVAAGVGRTRAFYVDSTRVRVIGQIDFDLSTRAVSGRLRPQSEQPELFTVAPTMVLAGTMDNPRVSVAPEAFVLAPLRFATPLAGFALNWLSASGPLREGVPGCKAAFEQARRTRLAPEAAK